MAGDTKKLISETALELFAQNGYLGTSMSDIAGRLGITKGALYKHYASKQEILDSITERMNNNDYERAEEYEMLKKLAETDRARADAICDRVFRSFRDVEYDPHVFRAARRELLAALS